MGLKALAQTRPTWLRVGKWLLLAAILLTAACFRFTNLNWDEGEWIHPDEGHMRTIVAMIQMPDSLALYFDTHHSPLNSRNRGYEYSYGTLPLFLTRMTAEWLDQQCVASPEGVSGGWGVGLMGWLSGVDAPCAAGTFTGVWSALVGRMFAALSDLGTVLLIFLLGRRLYGDGVGLLGAALGALTAFSIQQAHFFTVDSMACFFVTLTAYFSIRAGQAERLPDAAANFALAGLSTGLAAACKVDAVLAALFVVLAAVWRWWDRGPEQEKIIHSSWWLLFCLALAGLLSLIAFRVGQPYAFEGPGFFGVRPSPEWFGRLKQIRVEQSGEVDFPWGRQWANRAPILFSWLNMVVWGMGLPLGLAAWAGWALAGWELWRGKRAHLVLWVWATLEFLYNSTRWVKAMRYILPLYPIFILLAAYLLVRLFTHPRSPISRRVGLLLILLVVGGAFIWANAFISIYRRPHTRLAASRWIYAHIPQGATIANEHYDWGLPLRIDGHDPWAGYYRGFEMQLYNEDTPEKLAQLLEWIDQADYIITASNRLYASIPRIPARYPLTIEYYRALFSGDLGFELAADFTSAPAIGPLQFPDQETPFPPGKPRDYLYQTAPFKIPLPPAEEAFSVYDHPRVLIFRKTAAYSRRTAEQLFNKVDLSHVAYGLNPRHARSTASDPLEFDSETWVQQQAGGDWSKMFRRNALLNRYPGLAAIAWWAVATLLGWLTFPLLFTALPRLSDRGYGLARTLALLLIAYPTWLLASLRIFPNTRATIVGVVALLTLVGGGVGWIRRGELCRFILRRRQLILLTEGLFALLYFLWIGVRLLHPDLWHAVMGGEKPMDFAYLNAVMKSTWFPPYNPWFAGSYINYYYFGFVIVGSWIKLLGTLPAIAYNLVVPLLFALTGVGAFSVACNLCGGKRRTALWAGMAALLFTVVLGNLGVVHLVRNAWIQLGGPPFPSTLPFLSDTVRMFRGMWEAIVHGAALPLRIESWYWHPTRIVPVLPGESVINEFPAFTFLYGDLHAHMIAFPITLLALTLAIYWARVPRPSWASLALGGLVSGALWPTNTWDYPTYLVIGLVALGIGWWSHATQRRSGATLFLQMGLLILLTRLLYLPYFRHFVAGYTSFKKWEGSRTPCDIYLWMHGILLFPLLTWLVLEVRRALKREAASYVRWFWPLFILAALLGLLAYFLGYPVALITLPVGICAAFLLFAPGSAANRRLLWFMLGSAMALSLAVEIIVLEGDVSRMNTVFKFYLQVWMMLAVGAGVGLAWVRERAQVWQIEWRTLWWTGMAILAAGGALFLPYGIRARAVDRLSDETGLTLDGEAYMRTAVLLDGRADLARTFSLYGDYLAIHWMQDNISGSPVIMEGLAGEYHWGSRVSIYTGLPTVIGWNWHQRQQRAGLSDAVVFLRRDDVERCYQTPDIPVAYDILRRYGVRYVYVGELERVFYDPAGLEKFDRMVAQGMLRLVYDRAGVKIYRVE